ncbi:MAG: branched-chain amino acid ABC transporter permease [Paracoccaceae bacterium]
MNRALGLHLGVLALLAALNYALPAYHHGNLARVMVLASYAMGYNLLFGYTGLLSLGHAMFFGAGLYGMGLAVRHLGLPVAPAFLLGILAALALSAIVGFLALRTAGVAFMIVTLMFSQAGYLTVLYFNEFTRGDEGFVIQRSARRLAGLDLSDQNVRYFAALALMAAVLLFLLWFVRSPTGRVLIAIRENEDRARMLGYDIFRHKLLAVVLSGGIAGMAGAVYGILFGYVGASFTTVQYSIFPLLWVLLGGAGTVLGPFVGTLFMFYLIDYAADLTDAYMLVAGAALVLLTLFARSGIMGELRKKALPWLP